MNLHYCFNCTTLLNASAIELHRNLGHDVDVNSQAYYEEIEQAAEVA